MEITRAIAEKVRDVVDAGLSHGLGNQKAGEMCVEAAVCFALGLPHGDDPGCVSPALRRLKIGLNDRPWSSPAARAAGLRRLAIAQLGSAGALDDVAFVRRVVEMTIRKVVPAGLRAAASVNPAHAEALEAAAVRCELEGTREAAREGERVARSADAAYAADADAAAADAAAVDADAAADVADVDRLSQLLLQEIDMRDGLKIVQLPGRYGYSVTRIGWLRRVAGDEWELLPGPRSVIRKSGTRNIDSLASAGPERDHALTPPSQGPEEIHRLVIRRSLPADERAWAEWCPRPANWTEI